MLLEWLFYEVSTTRTLLENHGSLFERNSKFHKKVFPNKLHLRQDALPLDLKCQLGRQPTFSQPTLTSIGATGTVYTLSLKQ